MREKKKWFEINYSAQFDIHSHFRINFNLFQLAMSDAFAKFIIRLY